MNSSKKSLVPLPAGSLLLQSDPEKKRQKFSELSEFISKPPSALERLKAFLPSMAAANAEMDTKLLMDSNCFNAEDVENIDGPVIEMNVALVPMAFDDVTDCCRDGDSDAEDTGIIDSDNDDDSRDKVSDSIDNNNPKTSVKWTDNINKSIVLCESTTTSDTCERVVTQLKLGKNKKRKGQLLIEPIEANRNDSVENLLTHSSEEQKHSAEELRQE